MVSGGLKLKVCGMRDPDNIRAIAAFHPEYMGFIFYEKSPRYVGNDFAMPDVPGAIKRVGVFVNASTSEMREAMIKHQLSYLQLHGNESPEQVKELSGDGIRIWKVFAVDGDFDFSITDVFVKYVDGFLFDTKGQHYGGNARVFDWNLLKNYRGSTPFMLSGGLNASNIPGVKEMEGLNLHGLDLNSGVESAPGMKDPEKIREVISAIRSLNNYN